MKKCVVLSGAGISADSGLKTFRDAGGLWEGHRVEDVATPEAFAKNPQLVLDFYNQRRRQAAEALPNEGHYALVALEEYFDVRIITQNVDDLHERAGSSNVLHLHGELNKIRSTRDEHDIVVWQGDQSLEDTDAEGCLMRPHIVWFGEEVPMFEKALEEVAGADILIVVGTSLQVYPAASLLQYAPPHADIYLVDPNPKQVGARVEVIAKTAKEGLPSLVDYLVKQRI
ncbi:NAD-dependent deacetylase [Neisseria arctica]|uniref:NAD-dependent protein deacylase n=1 Tax=Neisseria arctica TaxID=1470200 RepID=A0A0J1C4T9_9NEIS|nr:NAD-dependent deacylase [Neisseria arctica]KLT73328.1 NAD-dependent deacetylase [Neisseria arctica]UOO87704.1 NAD-dependent deacylase [Neisseria arctica]